MPRLSIRRKKRPKVSAVSKTVFAAPTSGISFPAGCLASLGRRGGACPRPLSAPGRSGGPMWASAPTGKQGAGYQHTANGPGAGRAVPDCRGGCPHPPAICPAAPAKKGASRRGGACPRPRAAIKAAPTDAGCCGRASRGKNSPRGDADVLPGAAIPYNTKRETAGSGRFGRERALFYSFVTNAPEVLTFCERCFIMRTEARGVIRPSGSKFRRRKSK